MTEQRCPALLDYLAEVADPRQSQGRRHPLSAVLSLCVCAMLCGYRSYSAIAEWGRNYGGELMQALGFTHEKSPCAATLNTILRTLDAGHLEAQVAAWAEAVMSTAALAATDLDAMAIDGKALRGSRRHGAQGAQLLAALGHRLGLTLWQQEIDTASSKQATLPQVLAALVLQGRVVTLDALHTTAETAQTIFDAGGDYVMVVKGNQPQLHEEIAVLLADAALVAQTGATAQTLDCGHGRIEERRLTTSTALADYSEFPELRQVFCVERRVVQKRSGAERVGTVYGVTSLGRERAGAAELLKLVRGHWAIENKLHWVRDVTFDEDRSPVRVGSMAQVMAALRNTVIGLLRHAGERNIAAACRRLAAQPWAALALVGIIRKTE